MQNIFSGWREVFIKSRWLLCWDICIKAFLSHAWLGRDATVFNDLQFDKDLYLYYNTFWDPHMTEAIGKRTWEELEW